MHKDLEQAFYKVVEILKADLRCKGGWQYGSVGRGTADIYSDYDPVYLIGDKDFEQFAAEVPTILKAACDELVISWAENYNSAYFKNFCSLIKLNGNLHQIDFFLLNADYPQEWMCRQHLKGCTRDNIIFDRTGEVGELLDKGYRTENYIPDVVRAMDTYWFHTEMLIKYFKRKDIFKLIKNIDFLFHAHVDLLLSQYDTLDWGSWESKVKHCVPDDKQAHLREYFTTADFVCLENAIKKCLQLFKQDAAEACASKDVTYPEHIAEDVIEYFHRQMNS